MNVLSQRGEKPSGNSCKQLDFQFGFALKDMLEYRECPRSMAEAMGGNKGGNCWSGAGPRRIQANFPGASAAEILIQESLEVLFILLLHLLRPLQRRCRFFL